MDKKQKMYVNAINSSELLKAISQRDVEKVRRLLEADNTLVNKEDSLFGWSPLKWNNYFYEKNSSLSIEPEKKNTKRLDDEIEAILVNHGAKNEFNEDFNNDNYFQPLAGRTAKIGGRRRRKTRKCRKNKKSHKKAKRGSSTKRRKHIKK
jgi:uncharacterized protein YdgA (DUF945 family)